MNITSLHAVVSQYPPKLEYFDDPSKEKKTREVLLIALGMGVVGYLSYELLKRDK